MTCELPTYEFWFKTHTKGMKGRYLGTLNMLEKNFRDNLPIHAQTRRSRKGQLHRWESVFGRWVVVETP